MAIESYSKESLVNSTGFSPMDRDILKIVLAAYKDFEERVDVVGEKLTAIELVNRAISLKYGKITKSDIMELCPTISQKSVETAIKKLVDKGVLIKQGNGRGAYYLRKM